MLARLTSDNRITLPADVVNDFPGICLFEVANEGGRLVLTPVDLSPDDALAAVWEKIEELGISESDISDAVAWARRQ